MKVLVLLVALVAAGCSAPATSANPSVSPSVASSTAAVTGAPSASAIPASSAASDSARYGYIVASAGRITVRSERTTDAVIATGGESPVASHDGKRIALWRTGPQGNNGQELRIVEVPSGAERVVTTIPAGQGGGAIAWANDDTGLLFEMHSTAQPATPRPPSGPDTSMLIAFDLSATEGAGSTTSELMLRSGLVFIPLAWDKAGKIASALTTGEGGYAVHYYTWDMTVQPAGVSPIKRTQFPWPVIYGTVQASHDAKRILAIDANVLRVWPIADIGAANGMNAPGRIADAKWRPGLSVGDIAWAVGPTVSVLVNQTSGTTPIYQGASFVGILSWRADGSAILVNDQGRGVFAVELLTRAPTMLSGFGSTIAGAVLLR